MAVKVEQVDAALIETVCSRIRERCDADEAPQLEEFVREAGPAELESLREDLLRVLGQVQASVEDWPMMRARVHELVAELDASPPPVEAVEVEEAKALLEWLDDHHFTFLGYREYE